MIKNTIKVTDQNPYKILFKQIDKMAYNLVFERDKINQTFIISNWLDSIWFGNKIGKKEAYEYLLASARFGEIRQFTKEDSKILDPFDIKYQMAMDNWLDIKVLLRQNDYSYQLLKNPSHSKIQMKSKRKTTQRKINKHVRNPLPSTAEFQQSLNIINFFPTTNEYGRYFYTRLYDRWVKFAKLQYNINLNETTTTIESMIEAIKKDRSSLLAVKEYRDGDGFKISPSLIKEFQTLIDKLEQYPKNMMIIIPRP